MLAELQFVANRPGAIGRLAYTAPGPDNKHTMP